MSVTVPATDLEGTKLNGVVTALGTMITAAQTAGNYALAAEHTIQKAQAQLALVAYLMSTTPAKLNASTVLSTCTYNT